MSPSNPNPPLRSVPPRRTRKKYILLTILAILLLAVAGVLWYWQTHKKEIIRTKIEKAIEEKSDGFYTVSYDEMDLDEVAGWLTVTNMKIQHDSIKYSEAKRDGKLPEMIMNIKIPFINVTGVKTPRALVSNEVVGKKVALLNPVIDIQYTKSGKESTKNIPTEEIYKQILGGLDLIKLDTVIISGARITTRASTGKALISVSDMTITLADLMIDSTSGKDTARLLFSRSSNISAGRVEWTSDSKLYKYEITNIKLNSSNAAVSIGSFLMRPALSENDFQNALSFQDDRFDFTFANISLQSVSFNDLMNEELFASKMIVRNSSFKIYRDKSKPLDGKNRVGAYPHQVIDDIPFKFRIDNVIFLNGYVEYKEMNPVTRSAGKLQFHKVNAELQNLTNHAGSLAKNNVMLASATSDLMNLSELKTNWKFYLLHPKGRFDVAGTLGSLNATLLNPLTEPLGPATIKEGRINSLQFNLEGDDYGAKGRVELLYQDLKVDLLEMDAGATKTDKKFLSSLVANLVIKNSNPGSNGDKRIAQVQFPRDVTRSIFHLCWKSLFKGMRESIGVKK